MSAVDRDQPVADQAPAAGELTDYDLGHLASYLRLLDADAEGADWREVVRVVVGIDPEQEPARARAAWESHLARDQVDDNAGLPRPSAFGGLTASVFS